MIVITGGAGFIGSALLWQLNQQGQKEIVVVDHLGKSEKWRNLVKRSYVDYLPRERFLELLLRDILPWEIEAIVHLGACSSTIETDSDFLLENNFFYSRDVCRYALENGIRLIVASSAATYGDGRLGFSEDLNLLPHLRPLNMYGYTKQLLDLWLWREGALDEVASLKFFNVYGPNEYHKGPMRSVVAKAYHEIKETGRLKLFASTVQGLADGEQKRDFVYVKDVTALLAWLLENQNLNGLHNVGTGEAHSFNELAQAIFAALDQPWAVDYVPMPESLVPNYQSYTCADITWLKNCGCPVEFVGPSLGVTDYVQNYLAAADSYL
ncbi:MAG: ADP-glyceromanno-heptose 6-epimerase [Desulfovibrio sp.]|nr:ADP-glyceromanno-heptose 6-epimerase [Desulfovibrio sp.]